jgi:Penicillin binding protein transpeptidase domain/NTF2-like N-terminal transpeptidase domain
MGGGSYEGMFDDGGEVSGRPDGLEWEHDGGDGFGLIRWQNAGAEGFDSESQSYEPEGDDADAYDGPYDRGPVGTVGTVGPVGPVGRVGPVGPFGRGDSRGFDDPDGFDGFDGSDGSGGIGRFESSGGFDTPSGWRQRGVRILGVGAVVVALMAAGYLAFAKSGDGGSDGPGDGAANVASSTAAAQAQAAEVDAAAHSTGQAFLKAWQSGDDAAAAALTDSPAAAKAALDAYHSDLNVTSLVTQMTSTDSSGDVSFTVAATVHLPAGAAGAGSAATSGTWSYGSELSVYNPGGSKWLVQWEPSILAAGMASDTHLMLSGVPASSAGQMTVTDAENNNLANSPEPTLQKIAATLAQGGPGLPAGSGTPGIDVEVVDDSSTPLNGVEPVVVTQPGEAVLATTIDAKTEQAALAAVQKNQNSSMVVLQPTTGDILAIANNDGGLDNAMLAGIAPGSTMKVVTSTAMLNQGMSINSSVECPASLDVEDAVTHNSGGESRPAGTPLIDDFAASCNNAFAEQYSLLSGDLLERTARTYFGLNEPWDIGLGQPSTYFTMPTGQPDKEVAAEAFGQGALQASPLAMASVAATVDTGSFHQPVILSGAKQVSASPLPSGTDEQLKEMMRAVVTYPDGTAHGVGFGRDVYAKTGTAEDQPGYAANSWIIVYDPSLNVAIGCVVLNAGAGDQYAGPEVLSVLKALS